MTARSDRRGGPRRRRRHSSCSPKASRPQIAWRSRCRATHGRSPTSSSPTSAKCSSSARATPPSAERARRPTASTPGRSRSCCGRARSTRSGCQPRGRAPCAGGLPGAEGSCARTRARNAIHAVLVRRLITRPQVSDLFARAGRRWLSELELPEEERETLTGCMRQIEFLDAEVAEVERLIAAAAHESEAIKRLMSVAGVNVICAARLLAAVGDIRSLPRAAPARRLPRPRSARASIGSCSR